MYDYVNIVIGIVIGVVKFGFFISNINGVVKLFKKVLVFVYDKFMLFDYKLLLLEMMMMFNLLTVITVIIIQRLMYKKCIVVIWFSFYIFQLQYFVIFL